MTARDVALKAIEAVNLHDADAFANLYAADAVAPDPQYPEPLRGRAAIREDIAAFFEAFPDLRARLVGEPILVGDTVAFEVEMTGTHAGPLRTPDGSIPATNRSVRSLGVRFVQVNDEGRITSCRRYYDLAGILAQLGLS